MTQDLDPDKCMCFIPLFFQELHLIASASNGIGTYYLQLKRLQLHRLYTSARPQRITKLQLHGLCAREENRNQEPQMNSSR